MFTLQAGRCTTLVACSAMGRRMEIKPAAMVIPADTNLSATLQPGSAALFLLVDQITVDKVVQEMAPHQLGGRLLRSSLSQEAEQRLSDAVEAARLTRV